MQREMTSFNPSLSVPMAALFPRLFHFHLRCLQLFMDNRCLKSRHTQRRAVNAGKRTKGEQKPNDSLILLKLRPHKSCRNNNNSSKQRNKPQSGKKSKEKSKKSWEKRGKLKKSTTMDDGR